MLEKKKNIFKMKPSFNRNWFNRDQAIPQLRRFAANAEFNTRKISLSSGLRGRNVAPRSDHLESWTAGNNSPRTGGSGCGLRTSSQRGRPPTIIIPPLTEFSSSPVSSRVSLILVFVFMDVLHRDAPAGFVRLRSPLSL
jgi:hypothetical protein